MKDLKTIIRIDDTYTDDDIEIALLLMVLTALAVLAMFVIAAEMGIL